MAIKTLRFTNAGPFNEVEFEFDKRVNVFVGPNNSGKSTALLVLAEAAVFPFAFPEKILRGPHSEWELTFCNGSGRKRFRGVLPADMRDQPEQIGVLPQLGYSVFIPALRRSTDYRSAGVSIRAGEEYQQSFLEDEHGNPQFGITELRRRSGLIPTNAALVSDDAVIQKMIELDYAAYRRDRPEIRDVVRRIASLASEITEGYPIEFLRVSEDTEGLFPEFRTPDGDLPLNSLSQGTQSIIQWLSHFLFGYAQYYDYPEDLGEYPATLIVDEIDAHLHPSWQRRIIPALSGNFKKLQVFCSTHSPLMLAGLEKGQVQLLTRAGGEVHVSRNLTPIFGWSADEILMSLLDVRDPTDLTTTVDVQRLGELSVKEPLTDDEAVELARLREEVNHRLSSVPSDSRVEFLVRYLGHLSSTPQSDSESPTGIRPKVRRKNSGAS
jgi:energy-coupling factor transporter ATP-binding protein EcfA2